MKQETVKHLADGTATLAVSTAAGNSLVVYWDFINQNAAGIGVLLSFVFGMMAIGFNIYNARKAMLSTQNEQKIKELEKQIAGMSRREEDKQKGLSNE